MWQYIKIYKPQSKQDVYYFYRITLKVLYQNFITTIYYFKSGENMVKQLRQNWLPKFTLGCAPIFE